MSKKRAQKEKGRGRIGVISDTHGWLPSGVAAVFAGCDHILHAGDIGAQSVLDDLEMIAPVTAVLGNCDYPNYFAGAAPVRDWVSFELCGVRLFMTHRPKDLAAALSGKEPFEQALTLLPQLCIHGHTHTPKKEQTGAYLTLCPGSPVNARGGSKPSVAIIETQDAKVVSVEFIKVR